MRLCTLVNNFSPLYEGNFKIAMDEVNTYDSKLVDVASVAIRCQRRLRRHGLAPCVRVQPDTRTGSWTLRPSRPSMSGSPWCYFPPSGCKTTSKRLHWVRAPLQVPPLMPASFWESRAPTIPPPPPDLALGTLCGKLGACESSVLANAVVCTARSGCMASTARIYQDEVQAGDVPSGHGGQAASQAHPGPPSDVRAGPAVEEVRPYQGRHWRGGRWARCVVGGARVHGPIRGPAGGAWQRAPRVRVCVLFPHT